MVLEKRKSFMQSKKVVQKGASFVITYLLEDEEELSLGMLIRLKRIYNFLCSMLVYTPFA
jgi:hypothetical protein